jgi:anti-anti-sigma factor
MSPPSVFRVVIEPLEEACVIRVHGEVDVSTVGRIRVAMDAARQEGRTALLDLAGVEFMDSSGLHVLLDASAQVDDSSWAYFIVRPSASVRRLIALTETSDRLPVVLTDGSDQGLSGPGDAPPWSVAPVAVAASNGTGG